MGELSRSCRLGELSRPDGSVMLSEGETTVVAGVYGPVEVKMKNILIDKASVECHFRPKSGLPGVQIKSFESIIRNICETALVASLYPRSAVLVAIQEMQNSGQLVSCAVNAACLACLDSGIDMKCMFAAVTCFLTNSEELTLVPPLNQKDLKASFVIVFDNTKGTILDSQIMGAFSEQQVEEAINLCREESKHIFEFYKRTLLAGGN
ncbi:exosome complex component Rrp46 [Leptinotarsa decemlineata]|uniref:exosome complex component Rrp46 n=1 Tax=Leptinotarsa decemlineata TaxID=7539 RepID=UPI003D30A2E6